MREERGGSEVTTESAVDEHVERRVRDNEQVTEPSVEEERVRTDATHQGVALRRRVDKSACT